MFISAGVIAIGARIKRLALQATAYISSLKTDGAVVDETVFSENYAALHPTIREKASLALVPGAYKSGTIYAVNPANAALIPLAFTRASTATRTNERGLLETVASGMPRLEYESECVNMLSATEDFGSWGYDGASFVQNVDTAPNGVLSADKIIEDGTLSAHRTKRLNLSVVSSTPYSFSIHLKKGERNYGRVEIYDTQQGGKGAYFNLLTGAVVSADAGVIANIVSSSNGYYRCTVTYTMSATTTQAYLFVYVSTNGTTISYQGDGVSGIYLWGAQLEVGSTATTYVTRKVKGYLFEKASTNLLRYSDQFENAAWTKSATAVVTLNNSNSPDGTLTADKISINANELGVYQLVTTTIAAGTSYTISVWLKSDVNTDILIGFNGHTNPSNSVGILCSVTTQWQKFSYTLTAFADTGLYCMVASSSLSQTQKVASARVVYLWGAQLEASSFATSYIPTVASQVTRVGEGCVLNALDSYNVDEGTIYTNHFANTLEGFPVVLTLASTGDRTIEQYVDRLNFYTGTSSDVTLMYTGLTLNVFAKTASRIRDNDFATSRNGNTPLVDTLADLNLTANPLFRLGAHYGGTGNRFTGLLKSVAYIPQRISNADLQAITA